MEKHTSSVVVLLGVVAAMLLQCAAAQTVHVVGDSIGWTIPQDGAQAYETWAASNQFVVGDILTFNFITNEHDVLKVPKESYDNCSVANPIGNTTTIGPANRTLDTIGNHYFICTIDSHCRTGQKLAITVLGTQGGTPPSPSTSTSAPPSTPTSYPPTPPTPTSASPRAGSRRRPLRPSLVPILF